MISIYHNPRCSKSRQALSLLEEKGEKFEVIKYLDTPPSISEIKRILELLKIRPIELVRTQEAEWKENYKDKDLMEEEVIKALSEHPRLIQRPIVIKDNKAAIGRPIENILEIL